MIVSVSLSLYIYIYAYIYIICKKACFGSLKAKRGFGLEPWDFTLEPWARSARSASGVGYTAPQKHGSGLGLEAL